MIVIGLAAFAAVALTMATLPVFANADDSGAFVLPGTNGNYLTTGSFSHGTGDVDVIFHAAADDWTDNVQTIVSRWPGAPADNALRVQFTRAGHLQLLVRDTSGADLVYTASGATLGIKDGKGRWFRIKLDADNGKGKSKARFWTSGADASTAPSSVNWGAVDDAHSINKVARLDGSKGAWEIGSRDRGTFDVFDGRISVLRAWRADGTRIIALDFRDADQANKNRSRWTDSTGRVWTAQGNGWTWDAPGTPPPPETSTTTTTKPPGPNPGNPANDDVNALVLPGTSGNFVKGTSLSHGVGDMDIIFRAAADDWSDTTGQTVLARWGGGSAAANSVRVQFNKHGSLQMLVKGNNGVDYVYTASKSDLGGLQNGKAYWFRVKFNASTANGSNTRFWVSGASVSKNPLNLDWGKPAKETKATKVTPRSGKARWEIAGRNNGTLELFDGKLMYVRMYRNGFSDSGAKIIDLDLRDADQASPDYRTWNDGAGMTWQVVGANTSYQGPSTPPPPPPNSDPVAGPDTFSTEKNTNKAFTKSNLLSNDSDPDGDSLSIQSVATSSNKGGTITKDGATYTYKPKTDFVGTDTFVYTLADSAGNTTIGSITMNVQNSSNPGNYDVIVRPGDNLQALINNNPTGTSFYIKAGLYRQMSVVPKNGNVFVGEPGAIFSGAKKLNNWSTSGGNWVATGQTQSSGGATQSNQWGFCDAGYSGCVFPQDLFINGVRQWRVTSLSQVGSGKWYFDYGADKIYIGSNPSGKSVETSVASWAFHGRNDNVTIRGLTIQMYANPGRQGAVNPREGRAGPNGINWVVKNNVIRHNHGWGVKAENGMVLRNNDIYDNGQGGFGGTGQNVLVVGNEIANNCTAGFKCFGFEGGGVKLHGQGLTFRDNYVHDNLGNGIHTDEGSTSVLIENNVVKNNDGAGISHEISGSATIRNNVVEGNGFKPSGGREPGILVINSTDVEVYGNQLKGNANGILARQDTRTHIAQLRNLWVHDNTMELVGQGRAGLNLVGINDFTYYNSKNNRFDRNTYKLGAAPEKPFVWDKRNMTVQEWKNEGNDVNGTFL